MTDNGDQDQCDKDDQDTNTNKNTSAADNIDHYAECLKGNGLLHDLPHASSLLFIDYLAFKIEEVQKGTNINRLKKRIQLEIGQHTNPNYICPFAILYNAYIEECKHIDMTLSNYETLKEKSIRKVTSIQQSDETLNIIIKKRGRKCKNVKQIIEDYDEFQGKRLRFAKITPDDEYGMCCEHAIAAAAAKSCHSSSSKNEVATEQEDIVIKDNDYDVSKKCNDKDDKGNQDDMDINSLFNDLLQYAEQAAALGASSPKLTPSESQ